MKPGVLVLCTGNSARSQMAEGLLRHESGARYEVYSAGTHPTSVRAEAVTVMNELGIDISRHWSKSVDEFVGREFAFVITVCDNANAVCPLFPGNARRLHWPFEDPAAVTGTLAVRLDAFRRVRDQIQAKVREFVARDLERQADGRPLQSELRDPPALPDRVAPPEQPDSER